jgi:hypothetical protein
MEWVLYVDGRNRFLAVLDGGEGGFQDEIALMPVGSVPPRGGRGR